MDDLFRQLLTAIGEDPEREGLQKTPERCAEAYRFLTKGYGEDLHSIVRGALYPVDTAGMVIVRDIALYSLCEHHLLPFTGKVHVGYIPKDTVIGLSKIPRIVQMFARRLQVQERLGQQICDALNAVLHPKGVGVILEAQHLCMKMRGVEEEESSVITSHVTGLFKEDPKTREEFLALIHA